jgi:3-isopropylmalate dehydrogenase
MIRKEKLNLLICKGDGIGPEISNANLKVLEHLISKYSLPLSYQLEEVGFTALETEGSTFPDSVLELARQCDGVILGPVSHLDYPAPDRGGRNPSGGFRIGLDLYANIRPARTRDNLPAFTSQKMDMIIVRENTEGFYADRNMFFGNGEFMPTPDVALAVRKITRQSCQRIAEQAFILASTRHKKVTAVHKANVMKTTDGLFLEEVRKVAAQFPDVAYEEILVDAMAALLIRQPQQYDVIVTTNMFGDILSDQASELSGGLGIAGSLNAGDDNAMAQAQHGSAPDIAGQNIANPTSLMLSSAMLLNWLAERHDLADLSNAATSLEQAINLCLSKQHTRTRDLGGSLGTDAFTDAIIERIDLSSNQKQ